MKVKYYRKDDLLVVNLADRPFKAAEKVGSFIIHYDVDRKPVLLEILNASRFLSQTAKIWPAKRYDSPQALTGSSL